MDTKIEFYNIIHKRLDEIASDKIQGELIKELTGRITDYYFEQYNRFANQYPKSIKRYSTFNTEDLDHPTTFEIIIKYFKEKTGSDYAHYCKILLQMNDAALKIFEKGREDFYNK